MAAKVCSCGISEFLSDIGSEYVTDYSLMKQSMLFSSADNKLQIILSVAGIVFVLCFVWIGAFVTYLTRRMSMYANVHQVEQMLIYLSRCSYQTL